ncbi:MAG TPA: sterol desaturase family protein [Vicinamibacteria bacterium]|nr:sterol desaturase family protein [Vicinamibacteria bacterium]
MAAGLLLAAVALGGLERLRPAVAGRRLARAGLRTDLAYWFFTPLVTRWVTRAAVVVAVVLLAAGAGVPLDRAHLQAFVAGGGSAVQAQPVWMQTLEVLLLGDLIGYGMHRAFHRGRWWRFHAVHHSSREVDWLSSVRLHPLNDVAMRLAQVVPFVLLGFNPALVAAYAPFLTVHALLLHANVPWTFGPLRFLVSSPAFHRWHHTTEAEGLDKNFAGLFPFIDLALGTFYMPPGRQPQRFGILGGEVPEGLWAQLRYPFLGEGAVSVTAPELPAAPASAPAPPAPPR